LEPPKANFWPPKANCCIECQSCCKSLSVFTNFFTADRMASFLATFVQAPHIYDCRKIRYCFSSANFICYIPILVAVELHKTHVSLFVFFFRPFHFVFMSPFCSQLGNMKVMNCIIPTSCCIGSDRLFHRFATFGKHMQFLQIPFFFSEMVFRYFIFDRAG
jgi:hypothetical protein